MKIDLFEHPWLVVVRHVMDTLGAWLSMLFLRIFLAYEFFLAGVEKWRGENWFAEIQNQFPFPFNLLPVDLSWSMAMWTELLAPIALVLGLLTRFASLSLLVLTLVAWASVHATHGYNVCDNGFKMPLIYALMLVPLLLSGAGKLSLDYWLSR